MDKNWALRDVQLAFDGIDRLFFLHFGSYFGMIGQGPTYWSKVSRTFEGHCDYFDLTDGHLLGKTTVNTSLNYSMTRPLQSRLEASGTHRAALRNHIPFMVQVIQLAFDACMGSLSVECRTKPGEAHEGDQQFGGNKRLHSGKSQRLRKEGNARINMVLAMKPGLAKIIEKVRIS